MEMKDRKLPATGVDIPHAPETEQMDEEQRKTPRRSTARSLLKHAGTWVGDDGQRCLKEVYAARGESLF
jgi:hypothetical protein